MQDLNQILIEINKKVKTIESLKMQIKKSQGETYEEWINKRKISNIIEEYKYLKKEIEELEMSARKLF